MLDGYLGPIVDENLFKALSGVRFVDDDPRVAIAGYAGSQPVVATHDREFVIDHLAYGV
jgi:hypothetical protein